MYLPSYICNHNSWDIRIIPISLIQVSELAFLEHISVVVRNTEHYYVIHDYILYLRFRLIEYVKPQFKLRKLWKYNFDLNNFGIRGGKVLFLRLQFTFNFNSQNRLFVSHCNLFAKFTESFDWFYLSRYVFNDTYWGSLWRMNIT